MFPVIDAYSDGPTWPTAAVFLGLEGTKNAPHLNRDAGLPDLALRLRHVALPHAYLLELPAVLLRYRSLEASALFRRAVPQNVAVGAGHTP